MAATRLTTLSACSSTIRLRALLGRSSRLPAAAGRPWRGDAVLSTPVLGGGAAVTRDGVTPEAVEPITAAGGSRIARPALDCGHQPRVGRHPARNGGRGGAVATRLENDRAAGAKKASFFDAALGDNVGAGSPSGAPTLSPLPPTALSTATPSAAPPAPRHAPRRLCVEEQGRNARWATPSGNAKLGSDTTRRGQDLNFTLGEDREAVTQRGQDINFGLGKQRNDITASKPSIYDVAFGPQGGSAGGGPAAAPAEGRQFLAEKAQAYNEADVRQNLRTITDSAYAEGLIPDDVYHAYVARAAGRGGAEAGSRGVESRSATPEVPEAPAGPVSERRAVPAARSDEDITAPPTGDASEHLP